MHHSPLIDKRAMELHSNFESNAAIPIDGDVATGLCLLRAHGLPDHAAALRYHSRELGRIGLASNDGERDAFESLKLNGVRSHATLS
jgi:hypothetical protein